MWRTFYLTSIVLLSCGVAKSDDGDAGGSESHDHADILARLDSLEASFAAMQNQVDTNTAAIAAIDTSVLGYRLDELEGTVADQQETIDEFARVVSGKLHGWQVAEPFPGA